MYKVTFNGTNLFIYLLGTFVDKNSKSLLLVKHARHCPCSPILTTPNSMGRRVAPSKLLGGWHAALIRMLLLRMIGISILYLRNPKERITISIIAPTISVNTIAIGDHPQAITSSSGLRLPLIPIIIRFTTKKDCEISQ